MPQDSSERRTPTQYRGLLLAAIGVLIFLLGGFELWQYRNSPFFSVLLGTKTATTTATAHMQPELVGVATYTCNNGKSITAQFFDTKGATQPALPAQPPTPTGSVLLTLSDGRTVTLAQTISGSGIRYANQKESFIFWSKGKTSFVQEGSAQEQTYQNCVSADALPSVTTTTPEDDVMPDSGVLPQ
ncbi:MAG: hypothetical protein QG621_406 [Patescibacteria group bacterium]|nr:hypothetical protein [Patescibacteria group bacterium]